MIVALIAALPAQHGPDVTRDGARPDREWTDPKDLDMISNAVLATWSPRMLSVLRIVASLLFLRHGLAKLLHFPHVAIFNELRLFSLLGLAGVIALVGGVLLLIGFSRVLWRIMSGETTVAYFMAHAPRFFFDPEPGRARRYAEGRSVEEISWQNQAGIPVHKATVVDLDPAAVL